MCNYIYRNFSAPELERIAPSSLLIAMHHTPMPDIYQANGWQVADIPVRLKDAESYLADDMASPEFYYFLAELLDEGLVKLEAQSRFPRERINNVAKDFLDNGCENIWTLAKRSPRGLGLTGRFDARMSPDRFRASFVLSEGDVELHREPVFSSEPTETSWYYQRLRNLSYENGRFFWGVRWSFDLASLKE
ncbi:hypothetical protein [Pelagimonas phthalicica]|nr:hypothetical protein [Pelagimonas phthalicica]